MPFAEINDHKLYYEDTGGSGPVLLFSHGFVLDRTMWAPQIAASSKNFRCVCWDERGHGMSDCTIGWWPCCRSSGVDAGAASRCALATLSCSASATAW